ncbi:MAG: histidine kinase [Acidobacteria bacterium]|nr:histidine kinase [Acidobacteriota bacterium]
MELSKHLTMRRYWAAWVLFGLFFASQDLVLVERSRTLGLVVKVITMNLGQLLIVGFISLATLWVAKKFPLYRDPPGWHWGIHLLSSVIIVSIIRISISMIAILFWSSKGPLLPKFLHHAAFYFAFEYLVYYWGLVGIHAGIQIFKRYQEEDLQVSILESKLAQAQLEALKVQLNPHFLFNSLNTLAALILSDPVRAERMLLKFSQFFRISLAQRTDENIRLEKELDIVQNYLEIERIRFGNKLEVIFDVPSYLHDILVPAFLLQPLIENAIKHGFSAGKDGGTIQVRAWEEDHVLVLEVLDDGMGRHAGLRHTHGTGTGLQNMRMRLEALYGHAQSTMLVFPEGGGTVARITLPIQRDGDPIPARYQQPAHELRPTPAPVR